ncbi:MAG: glutamyl-tRNA reductase [Deltaproteobacteria bacterium]|nr:MAG: glutamyl-tRNA reductase [Deltaproteobacteria bacterium]
MCSARNPRREKDARGIEAQLEIQLVGLNHKTASVNIREQLTISDERLSAALEALRALPELAEVFLLSTCNRVEILYTTHDSEAAPAAIQGFLSQFQHVPVETFASCLYLHREEDAIRHLFRVAASLDSLVIGEPQILGQIKAAYKEAARLRTSGVVLNRLLHRTFYTAKRIRTETGIGDHAISISYAAIELARKRFGSLEGKRALLVGAGEMAELAVEHLMRHRVGRVFVANRTFERGVALAKRFNGQAIAFEAIAATLSSVDIVISSTGAPGLVIQKDQVKRAVQGHPSRPLFFIDIAVPRDIDPAINQLDNAFVHDIDDLKGVIEENIEERQREAVKGERIINEAVARFRSWREALNVVPTIIDLRGKLKAIMDAELARTLAGSVPDPEGVEAFSRMGDAVVRKIMHDPIRILKESGSHRNASAYLNALRVLFNLDGS